LRPRGRAQSAYALCIGGAVGACAWAGSGLLVPRSHGVWVERRVAREAHLLAD
jgi:hypothetical protein